MTKMHSYQPIADDDVEDNSKENRKNKWLNDVWINKKKQINTSLTVIIVIMIICLVAAALFSNYNLTKSSIIDATTAKVNPNISTLYQSSAFQSSSEVTDIGNVIMLDQIQRLPDSIIPLHYQIHLQPNYQQLYAIGNVEIQIQCLKRTKWITMHKKEIDIQSISIYGNGIQYKIVNIQYDLKDELFYIQLNQELVNGLYYYLKIRYKNQIIIHRRYGFYRSHYRNRLNQTRLKIN